MTHYTNVPVLRVETQLQTSGNMLCRAKALTSGTHWKDQHVVAQLMENAYKCRPTSSIRKKVEERKKTNTFLIGVYSCRRNESENTLSTSNTSLFHSGDYILYLLSLKYRPTVYVVKMVAL